MRLLIALALTWTLAACSPTPPAAQEKQDSAANPPDSAASAASCPPREGIPPEISGAINVDMTGFRVCQAAGDPMRGDYVVQGFDTVGKEYELELAFNEGYWEIVEYRAFMAWSDAPDAIRNASQQGAPVAFEPSLVVMNFAPSTSDNYYGLFSNENRIEQMFSLNGESVRQLQPLDRGACSAFAQAGPVRLRREGCKLYPRFPRLAR